MGKLKKLRKKQLTTDARNDLDERDFALPGRRYPIHDETHARNALARVAQHGSPQEQASVRAAVKRRYPDIAKGEEIEFVRVVALRKDEERQLVYGVVLTPGVRDSQDDDVSPEDVEKAAHRFLVHYRKHDVQHSERPAGAETVESFIAPCDFEIEGEAVMKGAWVLVTHVSDPGTWERVRKGELTGYSIGGTGERLPDEQAA